MTDGPPGSWGQVLAATLVRLRATDVKSLRRDVVGRTAGTPRPARVLARSPAGRRSPAASRRRLQDALQFRLRIFRGPEPNRRGSGWSAGRPFRPTPTLALRTHVPRADDPPTDQALAPRAGARCRGNGTRVRDAGRGNARSRSRSATGSPACRGASGRAGRPHRRAPASPADPSSAPPAPRRQRPPTRTGVPSAGLAAGEQARLTARRRPVWEDGSAGRPGALPGAPDFTASRAALHRAARVRGAASGRGRRRAATRHPRASAAAPIHRAGSATAHGAPRRRRARDRRRGRDRPRDRRAARGRGRAVVVADVDAGGGAETVRRIAASGGTARLVRADMTDDAEVAGLVAAARAGATGSGSWSTTRAAAGTSRPTSPTRRLRSGAPRST